MKQSREQAGFILLDALMSLFLGAIVLGTALASFSSIWSRSNELRFKAELYSEARLMLDMLAFDIRMSGAGMPLGQSEFSSSIPEIGEVALPILPDSGSSKISFRVNELGLSTTLAAPFSPNGGARTLAVESTAEFSPGDTIYVSNMTAGGTSGLRGTISSLGVNTILLNSTVTTSQEALFPSGSTVEPVKQLVYQQSSDGITRDDGSGSVLLAPHSTLLLSYLDVRGNALHMPLNAAAIESSLGAIRIQIELRNSSAASAGGSSYSTVTTQTVALRNINLNR
jgi:hypothetical protein